jgi:alpha-L-rhamnosidase
MFKQAIPVFAVGKETEMNYTLLLRATCADLAGCKLYLTAASFYRLTVNGRFVAFGPARTAGGYARVDEIPLGRYNKRGGENELLIEVAGYHCRSLSTVRQPSFAAAELRRGDEVLLCTGRDFAGFCSPYRVQKCDRYSGQRHFNEVWDLTEKSPFDEKYRVALAPIKPPVFLPRVAPYPTYEQKKSGTFTSCGRFAYHHPKDFRPNRASFAIDKEWGCFAEEEVQTHPYRFVQNQEMTHERSGRLPVLLCAGEYVLFDLQSINVGFFTWSAKVLEDCELVLAFSELCSPRKFAFTNINVQNVIEYRLAAGSEVSPQSFEPYAARFAVLMVKKGALRLSDFGMRLFEQDRARILPVKVKDPALRRIRAAAESTFVHNALDLYTDCPSRERAGWLCDSFFTGRAEYFLTGKTAVEDAFLENYRLYAPNGDLPLGALPECYPADVRFPSHRKGEPEWIPQWNMWYVLEVCEYLTKRRPDVDKALYRDSVYGVLDLLAKYENADGLLQNLPSWNFVEWSTANEWVRDVNYPTNFLYAGVLQAAGALYGDAELIRRSAHVREKTAQLSFDGEVFIDNAVLGEDGKLHNTRNSSEAGQYYAMLFGKLDLSDPRYAKLQQYLEDSFAGFDKTGRAFVPVNAFIGLYLRIWLLMRLNKKELLRKNLKDFFGGMVASTGTLWEYKQHKGSYDHGFASFAALAIAFAEGASLEV